MARKKPINLLFGATSDYLPYATVAARSVAENANGRPVVVHFLYADIVKPISDDQRRMWFEMASHSFDGLDVAVRFYDITDKVPLLDGQNVGVWSREISMTHYMYLFAQTVLPDTVERVIYLDTDMLANCDLGDVYDMEIGDKLIIMAAPNGLSMYPDMSNSGFLMLNLKQWRAENTLDALLEFGRNIPRCNLCDQHLLYQYFTKSNPARVGLVDKMYNALPHYNDDKDISELKVIHYCGHTLPKPWRGYTDTHRMLFLWWRYACKTAFYERLIMDAVDLRISRTFSTPPTPQSQSQHRHHSFWWHLRHFKF